MSSISLKVSDPSNKGEMFSCVVMNMYKVVFLGGLERPLPPLVFDCGAAQFSK